MSILEYFGPFRGIWELDGPVLVGGRLSAICLKMVIFALFWPILDLFSLFWRILGPDVPVLVGGYLIAKWTDIVLEGCYPLLSDIVFKSILLEGEMLHF